MIGAKIAQMDEFANVLSVAAIKDRVRLIFKYDRRIVKFANDFFEDKGVMYLDTVGHLEISSPMQLNPSGTLIHGVQTELPEVDVIFCFQ